jgi:hypothetical protein
MKNRGAGLRVSGKLLWVHGNASVEKYLLPMHLRSRQWVSPGLGRFSYVGTLVLGSNTTLCFYNNPPHPAMLKNLAPFRLRVRPSASFSRHQSHHSFLPAQTMSTAPPSSGTIASQASGVGDASAVQVKKQRLPLPCPPPNHGSEGAPGATKLDVTGDGTTFKLDHLGPLVINRDGTMARIANWGEMGDIERKNTLRILGKRNQLRLEHLKGRETSPDGLNEEREN